MIQFAFYQTSWNTARWERGGWTVVERSDWPARVAGELFGRTANHYFDESMVKAQTPWLNQFQGK